MPDETPKQPLGQRLRDFITPALEDDRAKQIQCKIASDIFEQIADNMPQMFEKEFSKFFNQVSQRSEKKPQVKNPMIVDALTRVSNPQEGESAFNPIKKLQLPISTAFTGFSNDEVREMPGWIKLHMVARDMDISIKAMALTAEESKGSLLPPLLILDASKSYLDGAAEGGGLYPDLPPQKVDFNKRDGQEFHF